MKAVPLVLPAPDASAVCGGAGCVQTLLSLSKARTIQVTVCIWVVGALAVVLPEVPEGPPMGSTVRHFVIVLRIRSRVEPCTPSESVMSASSASCLRHVWMR